MVYNRIGTTMRSVNQKVNPLVDLKALSLYWKNFHDGQDTLVMCLEIQQRLLYIHHKRCLM